MTTSMVGARAAFTAPHVALRAALLLAPLFLAPLVAIAPVAAQPAAPGSASASASIPRPAALQDDVNFWIRVYSEITTNEGFLHDERNLAVVYEKMRFAPNSRTRKAELLVRARQRKARTRTRPHRPF
jgi:hypothetical protein